MATIQDRDGTHRVIFRLHGKPHFVMIGTVFQEEAKAKAAQVEYLSRPDCRGVGVVSWPGLRIVPATSLAC
jgi:hypothetical protein